MLNQTCFRESQNQQQVQEGREQLSLHLKVLAQSKLTNYSQLQMQIKSEHALFSLRIKKKSKLSSSPGFSKQKNWGA